MAFLFVPELAGSNWDLGSLSALGIELCATSNGKSQPRACSWRGWRTRPWIRLLYGTISRHSMAEDGVESWISSLRGFRVSHGPLPESGGEPKMSGGSGRRLHVSFARWNPESSSWKTCPVLPMAGLDTFLATWPKRGSMRNGISFRLPNVARHTNGNGSSSWPTVRAHEVGDYQKQRDGTTQRTLTGVSRMWMTPNTPNGGRSMSAEDVERKGATSVGKRQVGLESQTRFWPTPKTPTGGPEGRVSLATRGSGGEDLQATAKTWATPLGRDSKDGNGNAPTNSHLSRQAPRTPMPGEECSNSTRRLNPRFVMWLMGFPPGWTSLAPIDSGPAGTQSFQSWRRKHLSLLRRGRG